MGQAFSNILKYTGIWGGEEDLFETPLLCPAWCSQPTLWELLQERPICPSHSDSLFVDFTSEIYESIRCSTTIPPPVPDSVSNHFPIPFAFPESPAAAESQPELPIPPVSPNSLSSDSTTKPAEFFGDSTPTPSPSPDSISNHFRVPFAFSNSSAIRESPEKLPNPDSLSAESIGDSTLSSNAKLHRDGLILPVVCQEEELVHSPSLDSLNHMSRPEEIQDLARNTIRGGFLDFGAFVCSGFKDDQQEEDICEVVGSEEEEEERLLKHYEEEEELAGIVCRLARTEEEVGRYLKHYKEKEEIPSPVCTCEVVCTEEEEKGRWLKHYEEEKESAPLVCEVVLPEEGEEERWLKHYSSKQSILLVGEGDFSFSASLAKEFGSAANIVATSLNSRKFLQNNYGKIMCNIQTLTSWGAMVLHDVDGTKMATHSSPQHFKFDRIVINFSLNGFFLNELRESQFQVVFSSASTGPLSKKKNIEMGQALSNFAKCICICGGAEDEENPFQTPLLCPGSCSQSTPGESLQERPICPSNPDSLFGDFTIKITESVRDSIAIPPPSPSSVINRLPISFAFPESPTVAEPQLELPIPPVSPSSLSVDSTTKPTESLGDSTPIPSPSPDSISNHFRVPFALSNSPAIRELPEKLPSADSLSAELIGAPSNTASLHSDQLMLPVEYQEEVLVYSPCSDSLSNMSSPEDIQDFAIGSGFSDFGAFVYSGFKHDEEEEEEDIAPLVSVIVCAEEEEEERWLKCYSNKQSILLVGEGDFSFSASLAKEFGSAANVVATSLNSRGFLQDNYGMAMYNIQILTSRGAMVLHEVDGTKMATHSSLQHLKFNRIVFNFPLNGFFPNESRESQLRRYREFVRLFMANAKKMIKRDGKIHITHKSYGFYLEWNLEEIGSQQGLRLLEEVPFSHLDYPGYRTKYGFGGDKNFYCYPCKTYKFEPKRSWG